jgi:hypothetical protein
MKYVIVTFSVCIAMGCFWMAFKMIRTYLRVRSWKKTEATILSKKVEQLKRYSTSRLVSFRPVIEYSYIYNGTAYQEHTLNLEELNGGHRGYRKNHAEKFIDQMPTTVTIYVNPSDPLQSVIFCDGMMVYFLIAGAGFLSLFVGLTYLV